MHFIKMATTTLWAGFLLKNSICMQSKLKLAMQSYDEKERQELVYSARDVGDDLGKSSKQKTNFLRQKG